MTDTIVKVGKPLTPDQPLACAADVTGAIPVFPIREDGKHMNWGLTGPSLEKAIEKKFIRVTKSRNDYQPYNFTYLTIPSIKKVEDGEYSVTRIREDGSKVVVIPGVKTQQGTTAWKKNLYDANAYGSQVLGAFLQDKKFPFPKSIYAVFDTLQRFLVDKPSALIVDFFAGSGTTLHSLNLLNSTDDGKRRCILVTNNEVSSDEAQQLLARGLKTGSEEWVSQGICRSVTFPRSKCSILGKRIDGVDVEGEYITGKNIKKEKPRKFHQIGFTSTDELNTVAKKKQLVGLIKNIPQTEVKKSTAFVVSDRHSASILFDESQIGSWLDVLKKHDNIIDFYIVTPQKANFNVLKDRIQKLLGPMIVTEEEKRLMREGFPSNLEYFKLDFLNKDQVALGQQFREILPILWLRAGAIGPRPELPKNEIIPAMLLPDHNPFAVLIQEARFVDFLTQLDSRKGVTHVFLVTDSEDSFQEMAAQINVPHVVQLYRDYLENFVINKGESA